jgi:hypothetical protein
MADGQGGIGKAVGTVLGIASQGNLLLAGVVQAITLYRQAREAWKAAHPPKSDGGQDGDQPTWLEDEELIGLLKQDSDKLVNHANQLLQKFAAAPVEPAEG